MKISMLFTLPLAAALVLPAVAQQAASNDSQQQPAATAAPSGPQSSQSSSQPVQTAPDANSDQNLSARQPLQPEVREGFWGKIEPIRAQKICAASAHSNS